MSLESKLIHLQKVPNPRYALWTFRKHLLFETTWPKYRIVSISSALYKPHAILIWHDTIYDTIFINCNWVSSSVLQTKVAPIPVSARSKAWVYDRSLPRNVGSNPAGGMDGCLLWMLCVARYRSLRRGRSLIQRSPTECGASECDRRTSHRRLRSTRAVEPCEKKR